MMMKALFATMIAAIFVSVFASGIDGQTKTRKSTVKRPVAKAAVPVETKREEPVPETVSAPPKRNERPSGSTNNPGVAVSKRSTWTEPTAFSYEFSQPNFTLALIRVDHDENGKGKISFTRKDYDEAISDPVSLSKATIDRLNTFFDELNFLDSNEDYQYEKDYSHLGNIKITRRKDGRQRTAAFNWTENKSARKLADEYRKITNEYVWIFDIKLARENQPLETPQIMSRLEGLIKRNEISDPPHLIPFLTELNNDERLPLMARNNASRLIAQILKQVEKAAK